MFSSKILKYNTVAYVYLNCVLMVIAECLALTGRHYHWAWGSPCDLWRTLRCRRRHRVTAVHCCHPSVMIEQCKQRSICFRPDTLSPALRWQLVGWHHRVYATWTLPGSAASDYAMQRGDFRTTRVNAASSAVPFRPPLRYWFTVISSFVC